MLGRNDILQAAIKDVVKQAIWALFSRHERSGEPDFWVFGSRRSGTTLLMEVIGSNSGVKYCFEPVQRLLQHVHDIEVLDFAENSDVLHMYPQAEVDIRTCLAAISEGSLCLGHEWRPWVRNFRFRSNRVVFKFIDSLNLLSWIEESFNAHGLYITRHPLSQSSSSIRLGWGDRYRPYLRNSGFVERYLGGAALGRCMDIHRAGSPVERHVLSWCFENIKLIREINEKPERGYVSYEELTRDPTAVIVALSEAYGLRDIKAMCRTARLPSLSAHAFSTAEARAIIQDRDADNLLSRWRKQISDEEERVALRILEMLEIDLYVPGENMARQSMVFPNALRANTSRKIREDAVGSATECHF